MKVTIAGNVKDIKEGTTLAQLVVDEKVENPEYVTVTVNDDFVENHDLANVTLKENDVVEFLYFMGGGSFQWHLPMSRWSVTAVTSSCRRLV